MRINKNNKGYTLAEIMIVILLLTIIFAAFAPIVTKRLAKDRSADVWTSTDAPDFDAYTDSAYDKNGAMFLGLNPLTENDIKSDAYLPLSKLVIRSGPYGNAPRQAQIQFRHGAGANRTFAGNWLVDPNGNYLLGGEYLNHYPTPTEGELPIVSHGRPYDYTAIGSGALNSITDKAYTDDDTTYVNISNKNTAVGSGALNSLSGGYNNLAVGSDAGQALNVNMLSMGVGGSFTFHTIGGRDNTFVGYRAGYNVVPKRAVLTLTGNNNVAVGYNAFGNNLAYNSTSVSTGTNNTFIGAYAGYYNSMDDGEPNRYFGHNNVAVGYRAMGYEVGEHSNYYRQLPGSLIFTDWNQLTGYNNIATGSGALQNVTTGSYNVAIGYNACSEVTAGSYKTCIGYNSGPHENTPGIFYPDADKLPKLNFKYSLATGPVVNYAYFDGRVDQVERTYIGSQPKNGFGGDAVLEIHNPRQSSTGIPSRASGATGDNATTVINGNLIVRGSSYFTVGNKLYHFNTANFGTSENPAYYYGYLGDSRAQVTATGASAYTGFSSNSKYPNLFPGNVSSDRRLKDIGSRFTAGLNELRNIKVYNYNFKDDKDKKPHVGVIAQELQKVFPTAVFTGEDGYLKIRWDELFYAVVNGIKELDKRVVALAKRTVNFDSKISKLEKQNSELKSQVADLTVRVNKLK